MLGRRLVFFSLWSGVLFWKWRTLITMEVSFQSKYSMNQFQHNNTHSVPWRCAMFIMLDEDGSN